MHQFMQMVVIPDKDLVPTRTRWRDDKLIVLSFVLGGVLLLVTIALAVFFATQDKRPSRVGEALPAAAPALRA